MRKPWYLGTTTAFVIRSIREIQLILEQDIPSLLFILIRRGRSLDISLRMYKNPSLHLALIISQTVKRHFLAGIQASSLKLNPFRNNMKASIITAFLLAFIGQVIAAPSVELAEREPEPQYPPGTPPVSHSELLTSLD